MKIFRYFVVVALMLGLSGIARATVIHVLDPSGSQTDFPAVTDNPASDSINVTFYDCTFVSGAGCFEIANNSTNYITSLTFTVTVNADATDPNTGLPYVLPSDPTCDTSGVTNSSGVTYTGAFSTVDACSSSANTLTFTLSGAPGIAPGQNLLIVEDDIPDDVFGTQADPYAGTAAVTVSPEPNSLWLALTAMSPFGYLVRRRFRTSKA